ncbi:MAG TPA: hypothetical protein VK674_05565 [Candidatus Limnocylindria bacterium]|nr:hypothetical protein [Candidatus Limnocylindria bacterium]
MGSPYNPESLAARIRRAHEEEIALDLPGRGSTEVRHGQAEVLARVSQAAFIHHLDMLPAEDPAPAISDEPERLTIIPNPGQAELQAPSHRALQTLKGIVKRVWPPA